MLTSQQLIDITVGSRRSPSDDLSPMITSGRFNYFGKHLWRWLLQQIHWHMIYNNIFLVTQQANTRQPMTRLPPRVVFKV